MNHLYFKGQNICVGFNIHIISFEVLILSDEIILKSFVVPPKPEINLFL